MREGSVRVILLLLLSVCPTMLSAQIRESKTPKEITVLASSNLTLALTNIIRAYTRLHPVSITASFDATAEQASKIAQGGSADLFVSSHPHWINELKQQGLVDVYSITNLVHNRLVIAKPVDHSLTLPASIQSDVEALEFVRKRTTLVVGYPETTSLGMGTRGVLEKMIIPGSDRSVWERINPMSAKAFSAENALYLVAKGNNVGILFHADAYRNGEVQILRVLEASAHESMTVQAAVVAGEHMQEARDFLEFLKTPEATRYFIAYGFFAE